MTWNCILERVAETKSTNDDLLARWRAGELLDPVARMAHRQTAGKGRAGRSWLANPEDSLCFSLAYPFAKNPAELSGLSLLAGLAVLSGLATALGLSESILLQKGVRLKWPNDLLLDGAKFGGILIEGGQAKAGDPTWMIIGIGINLRNASALQTHLNSQHGLGVAALDQIAPDSKSLPDPEYLWLKLIESFEHHLARFAQNGFGVYQKQWLQWDAFQQQEVCITGAGKDIITGIAKGVDSTGALLLQVADKMMTIHAGDVSLRIKQ